MSFFTASALVWDIAGAPPATCPRGPVLPGGFLYPGIKHRYAGRRDIAGVVRDQRQVVVEGRRGQQSVDHWQPASCTRRPRGDVPPTVGDRLVDGQAESYEPICTQAHWSIGRGGRLLPWNHLVVFRMRPNPAPKNAALDLVAESAVGQTDADGPLPAPAFLRWRDGCCGLDFSSSNLARANR